MITGYVGIVIFVYKFLFKNDSLIIMQFEEEITLSYNFGYLKFNGTSRFWGKMKRLLKRNSNFAKAHYSSFLIE